MTSPAGEPRAEIRQAVLLGAAVGLLLATLGILVLRAFRPEDEAAPPPDAVARAAVPVFRGTAGDGQEVLLLPAGPDGLGEPRLSAALFPGETPPRELASFVVAHGVTGAGRPAPLRVDLDRTPVRARFGDGPAEPLGAAGTGAEAAGSEAPGSDGQRPPLRAPLPAPDALRLRALGGGATSADLSPGALRSFLLALPKGRKFADLTVVEWGDTELRPERYDPARLRALRSDPAGVRGTAADPGR